MADLIRHLILSCDNQHRMRSRGKPGMTGQRLFRQSLFYLSLFRTIASLRSVYLYAEYWGYRGKSDAKRNRDEGT